MEILSKKISEFVQKETELLTPIIIRDIHQVRIINNEMNKDKDYPDVETKVNKRGDISAYEYNNDYESRTIEHSLCFPYRLSFNYKDGFFTNKNIFEPGIYFDSKIDTCDDSYRYSLSYKFINASIRTKTFEFPQIRLPEQFKRISLYDIFPGMNRLVCFESEFGKVIEAIKK
jgi:hypothetical protein